MNDAGSLGILPVSFWLMMQWIRNASTCGIVMNQILCLPVVRCVQQWPVGLLYVYTGYSLTTSPIFFLISPTRSDCHCYRRIGRHFLLDQQIEIASSTAYLTTSWEENFGKHCNHISGLSLQVNCSGPILSVEFNQNVESKVKNVESKNNILSWKISYFVP